MMIAISIACLAAALLSGFVAWNSWLQFEDEPAGEEKGVIEPDRSRNRFLLNLSLMSNFIFGIAVIFNICAVLLVSPCSSWF
jgi:hypothetical protein